MSSRAVVLVSAPLLLIAVSAAAAPAPLPRPAHSDRRTDAQKLEGAWRLVRICEGDKKVHDMKFNFPKGWGLVFRPKGSGFFLGSTRRRTPCEITIGVRDDPKHMDVVYPEGPASGLPRSCIYRLDGDTLVIGFAPHLEERPKDFSNCHKWVFERGTFGGR